MDILTLVRLYYVIQCIDDLVTTEIDSYAEHIYYMVDSILFLCNHIM